MNQERSEVPILARLAGIEVPDDRLPALTAGFVASKRLISLLTAVDFGEAEPAPRFRLPSAQTPR